MGLEVNGKKYTKASYYEKDCLGNYPQEQIFTFKDNKQLILHL